MIKSEEILVKTRELLSDEGVQTSDSGKNKLEELIIPALTESRNIQGSLYSYEPPHARGFVRKVKNTILTKLRNITVAVMEKTIMRQQKYNELVYQAVIELKEENMKLREELSKKI